MADMREAGRRADAHRVRDLHRKLFERGPKTVARRRVIETLVTAGGQVCLDLWGGGQSADSEVAAGLKVISVENGAYGSETLGISHLRIRRALETAAAEDGYEARWGDVTKYAHEADVAFLDFCGPWSRHVRKAIEACRHMKAVAITLTTDHDINTGSTTQAERIAAYRVFLQIAWAGDIAHVYRQTPCRLLAKYKRTGGQPVYVFLLARTRLPIRHLSGRERAAIDPDYRKRQSDHHKKKWAELPEEERQRRLAYIGAWKRQRRQDDPEYRDAERAANRKYYAKRMADPEARARENARQRDYQAKKRAEMSKS